MPYHYRDVEWDERTSICGKWNVFTYTSEDARLAAYEEYLPIAYGIIHRSQSVDLTEDVLEMNFVLDPDGYDWTEIKGLKPFTKGPELPFRLVIEYIWSVSRAVINSPTFQIPGRYPRWPLSGGPLGEILSLALKFIIFNYRVMNGIIYDPRRRMAPSQLAKQEARGAFKDFDKLLSRILLMPVRTTNVLLNSILHALIDQRYELRILAVLEQGYSTRVKVLPPQVPYYEITPPPTPVVVAIDLEEVDEPCDLQDNSDSDSDRTEETDESSTAMTSMSTDIDSLLPTNVDIKKPTSGDPVRCPQGVG
jgi:hypothetical protein